MSPPSTHRPLPAWRRWRRPLPCRLSPPSAPRRQHIITLLRYIPRMACTIRTCSRPSLTILIRRRRASRARIMIMSMVSSSSSSNHLVHRRGMNITVVPRRPRVRLRARRPRRSFRGSGASPPTLTRPQLRSLPRQVEMEARVG